MPALRSLGPSIVVEPFAAVVVASDELSSDKVCGRATVNQGWTGKLFFSREGARPKIYGAGQGRAGPGTPPPHSAERSGEGPGRGTYWVNQLIEIIRCSKGNLNLQCIK